MAFTEDQVSKLMDLLKIPTDKQNFEGYWHQINTLIKEKDNFKRYYLSKIDNTLDMILNKLLSEGIHSLLGRFTDLMFWRGVNQNNVTRCGFFNLSNGIFFLVFYKKFD